jgi:hypothetical protein
MFEHVIDALVHGSGYERIATARCSDRTIRRRLKDWAAAGIGQKVHALALAAYDQMIGLSLQDLSVDGAITKAPCGGEKAGRSPVDRGKGGLKRSTEVEAEGTTGCGVRAGQPARQPTATTHPGRRGRAGRAHARQRDHAPGPGLRRQPDPATARRARTARRHLPQGRSRTDPGRQALGSRTNELVDERLVLWRSTRCPLFEAD